MGGALSGGCRLSDEKLMKRCAMVFCLAVCFLAPSMAFGEWEVVSEDKFKEILRKVTVVEHRFPHVGVSFTLPSSWPFSRPEEEMSYFGMRISSPDNKIVFYCVETPNERRFSKRAFGLMGELIGRVMPDARFREPETVKFNGIEADKIYLNGTMKGKPAFVSLHEIKTDGKYLLSILVAGEYDSANTVNKGALKMFADTLALLSPDKEPSPKDEKGHASSRKAGSGKKNIDNSDFQ